jgi:uncharacterized membrane protein
MPWWSPKAARDQPEIDLDRSPIEIVLMMVGAVAVTLHFMVVIYYWGELPARIPIHFDLSGQPDDWGGRGWLIALPLLAAVAWGGLSLMLRIPHRYNYPWPITPENARQQYRLARAMIAGLAASIAVLLALMTVEMCRLALGLTSLLGPQWPIVVLGLLFILLTWYFITAYRAR